MKTKLIRSVAFLLLCVFVLSAFAGCQTDGGMTDTKSTNETEIKNEMPKTPLNLNGYRVIIPNDSIKKTVESLVAYELKDMLAGFDCEVQVKEDKGATSFDEPVILLGKTAATAEDMPVGNDYSIKESNGTVQISAGNYYGYSAALKTLKTLIKRNDGLPVGLDQTGSANVSNTDRAADGSIRVMFYNVLFYNGWYDLQGKAIAAGDNAPTLALRQDLQRDFIAAYEPDILGLQEYNYDTYHTKFDSKLTELGYTEVLGTGVTEKPFALFYKADKVTLVECGQKNYANEALSSGKGKGFTWAVFKENATNKQFAVFSTHCISNGTESDRVWDTERENNVKELLEAINSVTDKYQGISVIAGGDFNFWNVWDTYGTEVSRKPYQALTNSQTGKLTLASNIAGVQTNAYTATNSYHGYYRYDANKRIYDMTQSTMTYNKESPYSLDHIFVGNPSGVTVKSYFIMEDDITKRASDHSPTLLDMVLK